MGPPWGRLEVGRLAGATLSNINLWKEPLLNRAAAHGIQGITQAGKSTTGVRADGTEVTAKETTSCSADRRQGWPAGQKTDRLCQVSQLHSITSILLAQPKESKISAAEGRKRCSPGRPLGRQEHTLDTKTSETGHRSFKAITE